MKLNIVKYELSITPSAINLFKNSYFDAVHNIYV